MTLWLLDDLGFSAIPSPHTRRVVDVHSQEIQRLADGPHVGVADRRSILAEQLDSVGRVAAQDHRINPPTCVPDAAILHGVIPAASNASMSRS